MTVSMASVKSAGSAAGYFAKDNYYAPSEAEAFSDWSGAGAQLAGLGGRVDKESFEAILKGVLPGGHQIGNADARAHGTDLTFSMPKSASLLALVSGDKRLLEANRESVRATMQWVEANLAETRLRRDGKAVPVRTGNLVYAMFEHDTSRALDPQAHIHVIIANLTRLPEDLRAAMPTDTVARHPRAEGWRAWHNGAIWRANTVIGSIYHAHLRERIEELGYRTEVVGKHGAFEIAGIAPAALAGFSKRRNVIAAKAAELGIRTREGLLAVTLRTRDRKLEAPPRGELVAGWRAEADELGYDGDSVHGAALVRCGERGRMPRAAHDVLGMIQDARNRVGAWLAGPTDPLIEKGLARLARSPAAINSQYALASAINILSEREAALRKDGVIKTALDLGLKGVNVEKLEARMAALVAEGALVPENSTRLDGAVDRITTRSAIHQERRIVAALREGTGKGRPLLATDMAASRIQELASARPLNPGQLAAAVAIVASKDRIVLVQGRAGAGKSTLLQSVARTEVLDAAGRLLAAEGTPALLLTGEASEARHGKAVGLAFQNKMVADLATDSGIAAMTVHRFIHRFEKLLGASAAGTPAFHAARKALKGRYLILDEASMISNAQMDRLTAIANRFEVGRLAIIGDRQQIAPIEAGKSFALLQAAQIEAGGPVHKVEVNLRQRNPAMRAVADRADAGDIRASFAAMGDRVVETPDRIAAAATAWLALSPVQRAGTTLLTSGREGRARANALIQKGLRAEGTLAGTPLALVVRERTDLTREEMRYARLWQGAEVLEVAGRSNALGLAPGDYRIARVYANGRVGLVGADGRSHRIDPSRIEPGPRASGLALANEKTIAIHQGETLRWTGNDMKRAIANATTAQVEEVSGSGVSLLLANGERCLLGLADPMLRRIDLAYAINTHMAQGLTNSRVFTVMGAGERNLSNARNFLVNHTRQRDDLRLFTDDKEKLIRQIESNPGDKTSALETIGEISGAALGWRPDRTRGTFRNQADRFGMPGERQEERASATALVVARQTGSEPRVTGAATPGPRTDPPERPQLDRSRGLEL
jgi:conjugative relaxase-like TrwC/TraI family protein